MTWWQRLKAWWVMNVAKRTAAAKRDQERELEDAQVRVRWLEQKVAKLKSQR